MNTITKETISTVLEKAMKGSSLTLQYISYQKEDTLFLGKEMAKYLKKGDVINLNGELGSGKTIFMKGVASYFQVEESVSSPTFTIVNEYSGAIPLYHFDVYRIKSIDEFYEDIGMEYFENGICILEWGNQIQELLPKHTLHITITKDPKEPHTRYFEIRREL